MTTTPNDRKKLAEKYADRTAPTPAPVAVPEGVEGLASDIARLADSWHDHAQLFVHPSNLRTRQDWEFVVRSLREALAAHASRVPAPRNHPAEDAHPAPTPAPVAVPEGVVSTALVAFTGSYGKGLREMLRDALTAAIELWPALAPREDARPEPVAAPSDTQEALRRLLDRGVGTDLTPTVSPTVDVAWWYDYLRRLDQRWRDEVRRIADILTLEEAEPVAAPLPSEAVEEAWCEFRDGPDYQPTDRYDVRGVFEAGFAAGRLVPEDDEDTVRLHAEQGVLVDLLATLPPIDHSCFRPQGCALCGRSKERDSFLALLARRLDDIRDELGEDGTR